MLNPATADQQRSIRVRSAADTSDASRGRKPTPRIRRIARCQTSDASAPRDVRGMAIPSGFKRPRKTASPSSTRPPIKRWVEASRLSSSRSPASAPAAALRYACAASAPRPALASASASFLRNGRARSAGPSPSSIAVRYHRAA